MVTEYLKNLEENTSNLNTNWNENINIKDFLRKVVVLSGYNGGSFVNDDVDIVYSKSFEPENFIDETDENGNYYLKAIAAFGSTEYEGLTGGLGIASKYFYDPRFDNTTDYSVSTNYIADAGNGAINTNGIQGTIFDLNVEEKYFLSFVINYTANVKELVIYKYYHDFDGISISNTPSLSVLTEVNSYDITGFGDIPDGSGGWIFSPWTTNYRAFLYGVDDDHYIFYCIIRRTQSGYATVKVLNTLIIDKSDFSNVELHNMVLPNEVEYLNNSSSLNSLILPGIIYKGKIGIALNVTTLPEEEDPSGNYMCLINPADSTDIKRLKTNGTATFDTTGFNCGTCIVNSGFGYFISRRYVIKNDILYCKTTDNFFNLFKNNVEVDADNQNFYCYKDYLIRLSRQASPYRCAIRTTINPFHMTIVKNLDAPFLKTSNKPVKYTFRIKN